MSQEHVVSRAQDGAKYFNQEASEFGESLHDVFSDVQRRYPNVNFDTWVRQLAIRAWNGDRAIQEPDRIHSLEEQYISIFVENILAFDQEHFRGR